jgi:hypothetical protein
MHVSIPGFVPWGLEGERTGPGHDGGCCGCELWVWEDQLLPCYYYLLEKWRKSWERSVVNAEFEVVVPFVGSQARATPNDEAGTPALFLSVCGSPRTSQRLQCFPTTLTPCDEPSQHHAK